MRIPSLQSARSLAHLHAMVVVEELRRCGIDVFCLSPGARAIPLVLALDAYPAVHTRLCNDERGAAFWAQAVAKGGRYPCLVCTSGTAAANYLPAVAEAAMAGVPLCVVTTDRPFELQYARANQTLPQRDLFGAFAAEVFDLAAPEQRLYPHALLANIDQAMFAMRRAARPVHLNIAYRKPFVDAAFTLAAVPPDERVTLERWWHGGRPYCEYLQPVSGLAAADMQRLADRVRGAQTILCVAGPLSATSDLEPLRALATHLGAPLLADIHSGLRCDGRQAPVLALYNLYLRAELARLPTADLVLYFGDRLVSEPLREYLAVQRGELLLCSSYPLRQDAVENEYIYPTMKLWGEPSALATMLRTALPARPPSRLTQALAACEAAAPRRLATLLDLPDTVALSEGRVLYEIFRHIEDNTAVFLSASLIFREAEYFVPVGPKRLRVGANRGATGIDGVLASGIGFGEGLQQPCTVVLGDQALLHDVNALALLAGASVPVYIIVINNHSGAIFHFFELGEAGVRLRNPHPWNFRGVAENFQLAYVRPTSLAAFVDAYGEAQARRRSTVIEVVVDGEASVRLFQAAGSA